MPRRRKGRPVHGWLVIDKPEGPGSTELVGKAKWALRAQKAGHAGTLDPLASGVLAIAFGDATRTAPFVMEGDKRYRFTVRWGAATPSDDAETPPCATSGNRPSRAGIEAALPAFTGDIMQRPPQFSAVKVQGARAYDLARSGDAMTLEPRPLHVSRLMLVDAPSPDEAVFEMVCGKGGYVRAIARDLGEALGCLGHVTALRRLATGPFTLEDAVALEALQALREDPEPEATLIPVAAALEGLPELELDAGRAARLANGQPVSAAPLVLEYGAQLWASLDGEAVALGSFRGGLFHPSRVFARAGAAPAD